MSLACLSLTLLAWPSPPDLGRMPAEVTGLFAPTCNCGAPGPKDIWHGTQPRRCRRGFEPFDDDDDSDDAPGGRSLKAILPTDPIPAVTFGRLPNLPAPTFTTTFPPLIYTFCTLLI
jgi:hypothetical protein